MTTITTKTTMDHVKTDSTQAQDHRMRNLASKVGRFLWHFVQMVLAMMVSMGVYHLLTGKALAAYPVLQYAGMELSMIPPMVALMLVQCHDWRCTAEMTVAMLVGPALFLTCAQFGLHTYIPGLARDTLFGLSDATMYLGMLGAMLYRREMYTRPQAGHPHAWTASVRHLFQQIMASRARHFIQHYLEMCVTMCLGIWLNPVFIWAAGQIGFSQPRSQFPVLTGLVFALNMVVPMAAWMRFRGMGWRHIRDMSIASLVGAMLPIGVAWLGIVPMRIGFEFQCHVACVAMLVPMILEQVNHATQRATVPSNPAKADLPVLAIATTVGQSTTHNLSAVVPGVESTEVSFGVTGMTCTSCAATIERNLRKVPGVQMAKVNFSSERATVAFDPTQAGLTDLIASVKRAGYGVATGQADLTIQRLTSTEDSARLEKALTSLDGVLNATVSISPRKAHIEYIPTLISQAELYRAVKSAGFEAVEQTDEPTDVEALAREREYHEQRRLLVAGLIFTLPLFVLSMIKDFGWLPEFSYLPGHALMAAQMGGMHPAQPWFN